MFPGLTTKLSEETLASADAISPKSDLVRITGSTAINIINPAFGGGFSGTLILVPVDGAVVLGTSGNILVGITMAVNRAVQLFWSKSAAKWYIDNGV